MPLRLPEKFESDLQSNQISLIPRVIIGEEHKTYISTHKINFEGNYYKPILLNVPSMKESIDIETRNFKISNVTLNISNFKVDGEIFSDTFQKTPLINKKVEIHFSTQSSSSSEDSLLVFKGFIRRISHTSSVVNLQLEDLTQSTLYKNLPQQKTSMSKSLPNKYRGVPIPISYGYLKNAPAVLDVGNIIKADYDETVSLVTPDSESYNVSNIWSEYSQFNENESYSAFKLIIDDTIIHIPKTVIKQIENQETLELSPLGHIQFYDGQGVDEVLEQEGTIRIFPFSQEGADVSSVKAFQGICERKPSNISCTYRSSASLSNMDGIIMNQNHMNDGESGWDNTERFTEQAIEYLTDDSYTFDDLGNINGYYPEQDFTFRFDYFGSGGDYENSGEFHDNASGRVSQGLIRVALDTQPNFEHLALYYKTEFAINQKHLKFKDWRRLIAIYSRDLNNNEAATLPYSFANDLDNYSWNYGHTENLFYLNGYSINSNGSEGDFHQDFKNVFEFTYNDQADSSSEYKGNTSLTDGAIRIGNLDSNGTFYGGFVRIFDRTKDDGQITMTFGSYVSAGYNSRDFSIKLAGDWAEIDILQLVDVQYKPDLGFLLDVEGRTSSAESVGADPVMRNPIEIIKDIFVSELDLRDIGVDYFGQPLEDIDIDEDSYNIAYEEHDDLKFDFSINKKIESKKLIEEISKYTLCYPYFNNQGKLTFPTIKKTYSYSDYEESIIIKDIEVIDFSFNKTKLENVYSMIDFNYNYNYAFDSYESNLFSGLYTTDLELNYNGHSDTESNVLEIECPYIRDDETADKVWKNIFRFYKHQHLTFKIKLPLKYIFINVGDTVRFDNLLDGKKAFGIDYTKLVQIVENQPLQQGGITYPLFFVTAVNKNLDSVDIEGFQIHTIGSLGNGLGDLYDFDAGDGDGLSEDPDFIDILPPIDDYTTPPDDAGYSAMPITLTRADSKHRFSIFSQSGLIRYEDILHWFEPQSFGLNSFSQLTPSSWDGFSGSEIRDYIALSFDIKFYNESSGEHFIHRFTLKNQGNHQAQNFDLQWENEILYSTENLAPAVMQGEGIIVEGQNINTVPFFSQAFEILHSIKIGEGLIKAGELSVLGFELTNSEGIVFNSLYNIMLSSESEFLVGDVSRDFNFSILDIIILINHIMASNNEIPDEYKYLGDFNQDGSISILDIVGLANYIMENS